MKPRILIADDHEITRIGLKSVLAERNRYEICGEAADGRSALEKTCELRPDVIILDVGLPGLNGLEVARRVVFQSPRTAILIFTEIDSEQVMLDTLSCGVKGFLLKSDGIDELLLAVEAIARGRTYFRPRLNEMLLNFAKSAAHKEILSGREREVLQLVVEGYCTKEIAKLLIMSAKTVDTHRSHMMRKLDIHSTAELVLYAVRNRTVFVEQVSIGSKPSSGGSLQSQQTPSAEAAVAA